MLINCILWEQEILKNMHRDCNQIPYIHTYICTYINFSVLGAFIPNILCDYKTNVFDNKILESNTDVIMDEEPVQSPESYINPFSHMEQPDDIT